MVKARRRLSRPELDTERARERLRALIEQGRQYLIPARECPNFSETYREKVVKYINELADDFGLQVQTGGIACNYFDRYIHIALRKGPISKRQMQMIASTCLLIAAKFFDRKLPPLSELAIVHNHAVSVEQFMHQEMVILEALEWKLHVILPHALIEPLKTCLPDAPFDRRIDEHVTFFIDLSVYGYSLKRYTQAEILGGSMLAAWKFSNESVACDYFLPAMADACATCEDSLKHCANELVEYYHVCFPDAAKMIPQPIEPGTEGPVQLVEFTDLFPGLPLLGTCASLPPAAAPVPLDRADSTATLLSTLGEAEDVLQGLADARALAANGNPMEPDDSRDSPCAITVEIADERLFAPVESVASAGACEERSETPTDIFTKDFRAEPAHAKANKAVPPFQPAAAAKRFDDTGMLAPVGLKRAREGADGNVFAAVENDC